MQITRANRGPHRLAFFRFPAWNLGLARQAVGHAACGETAACAYLAGLHRDLGQIQLDRDVEFIWEGGGSKGRRLLGEGAAGGRHVRRYNGSEAGGRRGCCSEGVLLRYLETLFVHWQDNKRARLQA